MTRFGQILAQRGAHGKCGVRAGALIAGSCAWATGYEHTVVCSLDKL